VARLALPFRSRALDKIAALLSGDTIGHDEAKIASAGRDMADEC
jgi:hypothetical protein